MTRLEIPQPLLDAHAVFFRRRRAEVPTQVLDRLTRVAELVVALRDVVEVRRPLRRRERRLELFERLLIVALVVVEHARLEMNLRVRVLLREGPGGNEHRQESPRHAAHRVD